MNKFNKGLERFWLLFSIAVAIFCIYEFAIDEVVTAKYYLIFLVLPILMYLFRRFIRIKMEKSSKEREANNQNNKK